MDNTQDQDMVSRLDKYDFPGADGNDSVLIGQILVRMAAAGKEAKSFKRRLNRFYCCDSRWRAPVRYNVGQRHKVVVRARAEPHRFQNITPDTAASSAPSTLG
jgi:hypothetical protein